MREREKSEVQIGLRGRSSLLGARGGLRFMKLSLGYEGFLEDWFLYSDGCPCSTSRAMLSCCS